MARLGNQPNRRLVAAGTYDEETLSDLIKRVRYVGSSIHKLKPADYGFVPPTNPRPSKSPCDDLRIVKLAEAQALLTAGIKAGMTSAFDSDSVPKYVWVVDEDYQVYEAKTKPGQETDYHGYRLGEDEQTMRKLILKEWEARRCPKS
ncbi:hypothetical protein [Sphingobium yanoikuyae]|uniref:hypothetical protein n=1 Tax=Sphingobium yanoikuyae TaxID=13690 RepID=UPI0028AFB71E|nr:hypothetical protein [Sphingobium yanoikuyae]